MLSIVVRSLLQVVTMMMTMPQTPEERSRKPWMGLVSIFECLHSVGASLGRNGVPGTTKP